MNDPAAQDPSAALRAARPIMAALARPHRWLYARYGGRLINRKPDSTVIMLTTSGRRSGEARSVLINHVKDGDDFLVVGSNWGYEAAPAWVLNLRANPAATVTIAQQAIPVIAEFLGDEPRHSAWIKITDEFPQMDQVAASTTRELPVIQLAPS